MLAPVGVLDFGYRMGVAVIEFGANLGARRDAGLCKTAENTLVFRLLLQCPGCECDQAKTTGIAGIQKTPKNVLDLLRQGGYIIQAFCTGP